MKFLRLHKGMRWYVAAGVIALDWLTKYAAWSTLQEQFAFSVIPWFLSLNLAFNTGIAFGQLADLPLLGFLTLQLVIALLVLYIAKETHASRESVATTGWALLLGGAVANLSERLFHGGVVDFLFFHPFNMPWFIFNIADFAISVGVCLLLIQGLILDRAKN